MIIESQCGVAQKFTQSEQRWVIAIIDAWNSNGKIEQRSSV